jgi:hypothetical protein
MYFANPSALFWAALAIPVVAIYQLRGRVRRTRVPTLLFWDRVFERRWEQSPWRRLRHLISLLVQLVLLVLLVLALAEPTFPSRAETARRLVLIVDTSTSMRAGRSARAHTTPPSMETSPD